MISSAPSTAAGARRAVVATSIPPVERWCLLIGEGTSGVQVLNADAGGERDRLGPQRRLILTGDPLGKVERHHRTVHHDSACGVRLGIREP